VSIGPAGSLTSHPRSSPSDRRDLLRVRDGNGFTGSFEACCPESVPPYRRAFRKMPPASSIWPSRDMGAGAAGLRGDLVGCQECRTKLGSHRTRRWREQVSNPRSRFRGGIMFRPSVCRIAAKIKRSVGSREKTHMARVGTASPLRRDRGFESPFFQHFEVARRYAWQRHPGQVKMAVEPAITPEIVQGDILDDVAARDRARAGHCAV
jgi:hypothetical protein